MNAQSKTKKNKKVKGKAWKSILLFQHFVLIPDGGFLSDGQITNNAIEFERWVNNFLGNMKGKASQFF